MLEQRLIHFVELLTLRSALNACAACRIRLGITFVVEIFFLFEGRTHLVSYIFLSYRACIIFAVDALLQAGIIELLLALIAVYITSQFCSRPAIVPVFLSIFMYKRRRSLCWQKIASPSTLLPFFESYLEMTTVAFL